jgi:hypothetical protein
MHVPDKDGGGTSCIAAELLEADIRDFFET